MYKDHDRELEERINEFHKEGKSYRKDIKFGAPLFGYLLAAYNCKRFPLYKEDVFTGMKRMLGIKRKLGTVSENYALFYELCREVQDYFARNGRRLTMLEVQDFFYCLTQYEDLKVETVIAFIYDQAKKLASFANDDAQFLEAIKRMDREYLEEIREAYRNGEKINEIRFLLLNQLLETGQLNLVDLENIKSEVSRQYDTNILRGWNNFNILFHIYYEKMKDKVSFLLSEIYETIKEIPQYKKMEIVESMAIFDYDGMRNLGGSRCWMAVYPKEAQNHKKAAQLFLAIQETGIEYGLYCGLEHPKAGKSDIETVSDAEHFSYERMKEKFIQVLPEFIAENLLESDDSGEEKEQETPEKLHPDLAVIFDTVEQADWAFDFARQTLAKLGIAESGDERVAVTFRSRRKIHIDFCNWLILGYYREKDEKMMTVALIAEELEGKPYKRSFFTQRGEEIQVALAEIPYEEFRSNSQLVSLFEKTLSIIKERFRRYFRSTYRVYNVDVWEKAVFDRKARRRLFKEGFPAEAEQQAEA
ncbi:MAG: hypothetical protein LOD92_01230, partial [Bacillales bacterium]